MSESTVIATWHRLVANGDVAALHELLAADAVFHSPVVHTPQRGRAIVERYLAAAFTVLVNPSFHYVREVVGERDAVLEFEVELDGLHVNGVDMLRWNEDGRIVDFKVMVRPLKAINLVHQKMAALLAATS
jgi:ketosteroid isomerase-like protein